VAPQKWLSGASLKDRLFKEFYRFSFFKAVRLLDLLFPAKKPLGQTLSPEDEAVRFSVKPSLSFPPSDISNLKQQDDKRPAEMEVAFMGLIGPAGVLPYSYNEMAIERARQKDFSFTSFLDLFHHRLISLFYLAWKRYRFEINYAPGARDRLSQDLLCLLGLGIPGDLEKMGLPGESLIYCGGLLSRGIPSALSIEGAVKYFTGARVSVEQFVNRMIEFGPEEQTRLGSANGRLGMDAVCGSVAWENQTKFRVHLGPLGYEEFILFLPSGKRLGPVFSLVRFMVGIEYEFEICLVLKREEVPPCVIGAEGPAAPRLGWTTWMKAPEFIHKEDPHVTFQEPSS
jgi:type VI secretion system protein ImpH